MIMRENGLAVDYTVLGTETVTTPDILYLDDLGSPDMIADSGLMSMSPDGFTPVDTGTSGDFFGDILNIGGNLIKDFLGSLDLNEIFGTSNAGTTPVHDLPPAQPSGDIGSVLSNPIVITGLIIGTVLLIKK